MSRATRTAAAVGHALGLGLVALGVLSLLAGGVGGLWLAAIGCFLSQAARTSLAEVELAHFLDDLPAAEVMGRPLVTIPAALRVADAVEDYFLRYDHSAFPVVEDGHTLGLITLRGVRQVPADQREHLAVADCMTPIAQVPRVEPDLPLPEVLERLRAEESQRVLVADGDSVVGIITPRDVARRVQRAEELGLDAQQTVATGRR